MKNRIIFYQKIVLALAVILAFQAGFPTQVLALTAGPTQPELEAFEPVGTTEMVDLFSGDFVYNIPLFELPGPNGGYPFNLSYKPNGNIDGESGPFGLGWTLNPGVIKRDVRGVPDDADGDLLKETLSTRDNWTAGLKISGLNAEFFGLGGFNGGPSLSVFYNSYKGVGYSIGVSGQFSLPLNSNIGLGLTLNNQEGASLQASTSLSDALSLSTSINSRMGMSGLSLTLGRTIMKGETTEDNTSNPYKRSQPLISRSGSPISFGDRGAYSAPTSEYKGVNVGVLFRTGASVLGVFPNASIEGYYRSQRLKRKGKSHTTPMYGYLNHHRAPNNQEEYVMDYTKEKDGPVYTSSPAIGIPSSTPDIYAAVGQGIGGVFRPYRSDIGILSKGTVKSVSAGGAIGVDAPIFKAGASVDGNFAVQRSGKWKKDDKVNSLKFESTQTADYEDLYEPYYFKTQGDMTAEPLNNLDNYVAGEAPMSLSLDGFDVTSNFQAKNSQTGQYETKTITAKRQERKPRTLATLPLLNKNISAVSELNIKHFKVGDNLNNSPTHTLARGNDLRKAHHVGGFIAYQPNGLRYNYGLPAYNLSEEEYLFTVDGSSTTCGPTIDINMSGDKPDYELKGTDQYFKKTEKPAYAHAYLLTSVLGTNYVDVDDNGPSDADRGYWVKFDYVQQYDQVNPYQWRNPYHGAYFHKGLYAKTEDDKGSFVFGEKEIWMLGRVESKTHYAVFEFMDRLDGLDANGTFANNGQGNNSLKAVKAIRLYSKTNDQLLKTVHFEYNYELCQNTLNSSATTGGKLTLEKIYFTYENSTRGAQSPYVFEYAPDLNSDGIPDYNNKLYNPDYQPTAHDRWGYYKDISSDACANIDFPYTEQFDNDPAVDFKAKRDREAASWYLRSVQLPSGSKIKIDWEAKTYGHVQDRIATQMFKIASMVDYATTFGPNGDDNKNVLYEHDKTILNGNQLAKYNNRIYFELETPIAANEFDRYLEDFHINTQTDKKQLYYRIKSNLRNNPGGGVQKEFIAGYVDIAQDGNGNDIAGVDLTSVDNNGLYRWGYVEVEETKIGDNLIDHHPLALGAWQFMKVNMPDLAFAVGNMPTDATPSGKARIRKVVTSLLAPLNDIISMFKGYYKYCRDRNFASTIDLSASFIRLNSPDKEKYGAGARVKQITLLDAWDAEEVSTYGQVYTYEGGVAANEPMIGGDENALKHALDFPQSIPLAANNRFFFELPFNYNLYPAPTIGYSKVTVESLATHLDKQEIGQRPANLPQGIATTGKVEHEFYTAKDFPIITDYTKLDKKKQYLPLNLGNLYSASFEKLTATQGAVIIKNDMHGKPKQVSNFAQNDLTGAFNKEPYNYIKYNYQTEPKVIDGREVGVLNNEVQTITDFNSNTFSKVNRRIGVDYEVAIEMMEDYSYGNSIGIQGNVDLILWPFPPVTIPIPTGIPTTNLAESRTRTAFVNKIIHKAGIMKSVEAFDGQSIITTENIAFDSETGQAILTSVNNNFDDKVFNLNVSGHLVYDEMGPAYKNLGMRFSGDAFTITDCDYVEVNNIPSTIANSLVEGDEFLTSIETLNQGDSPEDLTYVGRATFIRKGGEAPNARYFFAFDDILDVNSTPKTINFLLKRSGRRNHLQTNVGQVTALQDPTILNNGPTYSFTQDFYLYGASGFQLDQCQISVSTKEVDRVLSISASTYTNNVETRDEAVVNTATNSYSQNPFFLGQRGVWKPDGNYVFIKDRDQAFAGSTPNLRDGGIMDDVPFFDYNFPFLDEIDNIGWKKTNQATMYTGEHQIEQKDILDLYSASLYGYNDHLPTAVATNSRYFEIGFESFEEFDPNIPLNTYQNEDRSKGHIDIVPTPDPIQILEPIEILFGAYLASEFITVTIDKAFDPSYTVPTEANISINGTGGIEYFATVEITASQASSDGKTVLLISFGNCGPFASIFSEICNSANYFFKGQIYLPRVINNTGITTTASIANDRAHSGANSLFINKTTTPGSIPLKTLNLETGKEYVFSCWISREFMHAGQPTQLKINNVMVPNTPDGFIPASGDIVDVNGKPWQRVEYIFTAVAGENTINYDIGEINTYNEFGAVPVSPGLYIDDIRIHPLEAEMESFVYDPTTYRLLATLDRNNYATYYQYDHEGRLTIVKKETEKGVKTLQESQSYLKEYISGQ